MTRNHQDEDSIKFRPSRSSRPRSKDRPKHDDAALAKVVTIDRGRYTCVLSDDEDTQISAVTARELGKAAVVVGDEVSIVGDLSGTIGSLARIVKVSERKTSLRRTADDSEATERVLVANANQLAIVVSATNPEPQPRLIDRALVAALNEGMQTILIITKTDLADPKELVAQYQGLTSKILTLQKGMDLVNLKNILKDLTTVLVGSSGVGKSTLVNALVPTADRSTGSVNEVTGRGRHTSTSAHALLLPEGGWIIDTPGIRTFGIAHVENATIAAAFTDLAEIIQNCKKACSHDEVDCALNQLDESSEVSKDRIESLRRLMNSKAAY
ncbi:MAG: GTPase [actinobacterium acAMD-5]|nr:MAG: GTPase [actinobacterium acAMD-5]